MKVAMIIEQTNSMLKLRFPSKSEIDPRTIEHYEGGRHHCDCPGHYWKNKSKRETVADGKMKWCRHHRYTTLQPLELFKDRINHYIKRGFIKAAWQLVGCQFPDHYDKTKLYCTGCPLYPETCNIHPILYTTRAAGKKPLVWKLQTTIFNGRRKDASRLFRQYCKKVKEAKDERATRLHTGP